MYPALWNARLKLKTEDVKRLSPWRRFTYWIVERESIRLKKEAEKPKPWTDDSILQSYRFCNVRRMDDKVSRWLLGNWYTFNFNHKNMLVACALARFINKPETLQVIGFPKRWAPDKIAAKLREYRDGGGTVFNGAYVVRGNDGQDKIESVVNYYVAPLSKLKLVSRYMQDVHAQLCECYGFGSFMAGQVVADLRWAVAGHWEDKDTWAPIGPGSKRGMNRLHKFEINRPIGAAEFCSDLRQVIRDCKTTLPKPITHRLEAMDYQNCFCEWDKYERVLWGEGKPKQTYRGDW